LSGDRTPLLEKLHVPLPINETGHVHKDLEKNDPNDPNATDRRGLIASFIILALSIPALIGA